MNKDEETGSNEGSSLERLTEGTVELRIPPKAEFLPVLRATVGVVAGQLSFNYDEVVQLRVAVSEAFEMALERLRKAGLGPQTDSLAVQLEVAPGELRILVADPTAESDTLPGEVEARAVIESLVDTVEFGARAAGNRVIRLVKHRPSREV